MLRKRKVRVVQALLLLQTYARTFMEACLDLQHRAPCHSLPVRFFFFAVIGLRATLLPFVPPVACASRPFSSIAPGISCVQRVRIKRASAGQRMWDKDL